MPDSTDYLTLGRIRGEPFAAFDLEPSGFRLCDFEHLPDTHLLRVRGYAGPHTFWDPAVETLWVDREKYPAWMGPMSFNGPTLFPRHGGAQEPSGPARVW